MSFTKNGSHSAESVVRVFVLFMLVSGLMSFLLRRTRENVVKCSSIKFVTKITNGSFLVDNQCTYKRHYKVRPPLIVQLFRIMRRPKKLMLPRDGVTEREAKLTNKRLMRMRDFRLNKLLTQNEDLPSFQEARRYIQRVNVTLNSFNGMELRRRFESIHVFGEGPVCDGCTYDSQLRFPGKEYVNGELIRKFVGGVETSIIYNMSNRFSCVSL